MADYDKKESADSDMRGEYRNLYRSARAPMQPEGDTRTRNTHLLTMIPRHSAT